MKKKRFYLQYTFPPSCVGETGNLTERSLAPSLLSEGGFPYTICVESLVTEINGSSSMALVCGGVREVRRQGRRHLWRRPH